MIDNWIQDELTLPSDLTSKVQQKSHKIFLVSFEHGYISTEYFIKSFDLMWFNLIWLLKKTKKTLHTMQPCEHDRGMGCRF